MSPAENIPGLGEQEIKEDGGGVNSTEVCCKNLCKCHNYPSTTIMEKKKTVSAIQILNIQNS
jgi:hypothetical protein